MAFLRAARPAWYALRCGEGLRRLELPLPPLLPPEVALPPAADEGSVFIIFGESDARWWQEGGWRHPEGV